jgi:hypothetical protein
MALSVRDLDEGWRALLDFLGLHGLPCVIVLDVLEEGMVRKLPQQDFVSGVDRELPDLSDCDVDRVIDSKPPSIAGLIVSCASGPSTGFSIS